MISQIFKGTLKTPIDKRSTEAWAVRLTDSFTAGYGKDLSEVDYDTPDFEMMRQLHANIWSFSAAKDYQMLQQMNAALRDAKTFSEFKAACESIGEIFNTTHLQTEYNFANASAQMASQWVRYQENVKEFPNLKYQTVGDKRVRQSHRLLDGIVRPMNDAFWNTYYPPNGWGCRCDVVQTEPGKITDLTAKPYPKVESMFKVNLAKTGRIYPEKHPYFDVPEEDWTTVQRQARTIMQKSMRQLAFSRLQNEIVNMDKIGEVKFTNSALKECFNQPHVEGQAKNFLLLNPIKAMKDAKYLSSSEYNGKDQQTVRFHYLKSGKNYYWNIKELKTGEKVLYSITDKIKKG